MLNQSTTAFLSLCSIRLFYSGTRRLGGVFQTLFQQIITLFISSSSALLISMWSWASPFPTTLLPSKLWLKVRRGRGTWGLGTRRLGGTRGLRDAGTRELGDTETRGCWTRKRWDSGTWEVYTRGSDKQTTPYFCSEFVKHNFRCSRERYYMLERFLSRLVADDFQRSWFGLICLLAYIIVKALGRW